MVHISENAYTGCKKNVHTFIRRKEVLLFSNLTNFWHAYGLSKDFLFSKKKLILFKNVDLWSYCVNKLDFDVLRWEISLPKLISKMHLIPWKMTSNYVIRAQIMFSSQKTQFQAYFGNFDHFSLFFSDFNRTPVNWLFWPFLTLYLKKDNQI